MTLNASTTGPDDLLARIEGLIPTMSRSDVKIARKLLAKPDEFIRASVRAIASEIGVSEPTIVRFCRNAGFEGFRDLKFRLTQELAFQQAQRDARVVPQSPAVDVASTTRPIDPQADYAQRLHAKAVEALDQAMAVCKTDLIAEAADILARARKVVVYGIGGSSAIMAEEVHNRLYRLGVASTVFTDSYAQRMAAATLREGDAAIFVSSTGRPRSLQDSMELARYYNAKTIAISDMDTPLGRDADVCINVPLSQSGVDEFQPNPMRFSQLLMIDLLAYQTAERLGPDARQALRQTRASVASLHGIAPQQPIGD